MTQKYINLHCGKVEITRFPNPIATKSTLQGILEAMENGSNDMLVCSIQSAVDVMQDHRWMLSVAADPDTIENLIKIINEEA